MFAWQQLWLCEETENSNKARTLKARFWKRTFSSCFKMVDYIPRGFAQQERTNVLGRDGVRKRDSMSQKACGSGSQPQFPRVYVIYGNIDVQHFNFARAVRHGTEGLLKRSWNQARETDLSHAGLRQTNVLTSKMLQNSVTI